MPAVVVKAGFRENCDPVARREPQGSLASADLSGKDPLQGLLKCSRITALIQEQIRSGLLQLPTGGSARGHSHRAGSKGASARDVAWSVANHGDS